MLVWVLSKCLRSWGSSAVSYLVATLAILSAVASDVASAGTQFHRFRIPFMRNIQKHKAHIVLVPTPNMITLLQIATYSAVWLAAARLPCLEFLTQHCTSGFNRSSNQYNASSMFTFVHSFRHYSNPVMHSVMLPRSLQPLNSFLALRHNREV